MVRGCRVRFRDTGSAWMVGTMRDGHPTAPIGGAGEGYAWDEVERASPTADGAALVGKPGAVARLQQLAAAARGLREGGDAAGADAARAAVTRVGAADGVPHATVAKILAGAAAQEHGDDGDDGAPAAASFIAGAPMRAVAPRVFGSISAAPQIARAAPPAAEENRDEPTPLPEPAAGSTPASEPSGAGGIEKGAPAPAPAPAQHSRPDPP
eukprot:gene28445-39024_t